MKLKNVFLTISLVSFAIGFISTGESIFWYLGLPVGAIFFGLFMIFMILEKETALLDEQSGCGNCQSGNCSNGKSAQRKGANKGNRPARLTSAPSH